MSTFEKRAREQKLADKARDKAARREEKRGMAPAQHEVVTQASIIGNLRSSEEVMREITQPRDQQRSAAPIPSKFFVGSLSDSTTSASLRAHFAADFDISDAVVVMDRGTGASRNFGFVTATDRKDAPAIISALNQSELDGANIVVRIATEQQR